MVRGIIDGFRYRSALKRVVALSKDLRKDISGLFKRKIKADPWKHGGDTKEAAGIIGAQRERFTALATLVEQLERAYYMNAHSKQSDLVSDLAYRVSTEGKDCLKEIDSALAEQIGALEAGDHARYRESLEKELGVYKRAKKISVPSVSHVRNAIDSVREMPIDEKMNWTVSAVIAILTLFSLSTVDLPYVQETTEWMGEVGVSGATLLLVKKVLERAGIFRG